MLRSLISIDLFPSDLSGSEVGAIFLDLALATHTQEVLRRSIWPFRVITIEDAVLTRSGAADSIYVRQFFDMFVVTIMHHALGYGAYAA